MAGEFKQLGPVFLSLYPHAHLQRAQLGVGNGLRAAVWQLDNFRYVVVVNEVNQQQGRVKLDLSEVAGARDVEVLFEDRTLQRERDGSLSDHFAPYDVHIYRIRTDAE